MMPKLKVGDVVRLNKGKGLYHGDNVFCKKAFDEGTKFVIEDCVTRDNGYQEIQTTLTSWLLSNLDLELVRKPLIIIGA